MEREFTPVGYSVLLTLISRVSQSGVSGNNIIETHEVNTGTARGWLSARASNISEGKFGMPPQIRTRTDRVNEKYAQYGRANDGSVLIVLEEIPYLQTPEMHAQECRHVL